MLSLRQWRPKHLLLSWSAYWAGLAAVTFAPAIAPLRGIAVPGGKGTFSAGFNDSLLHVTIGNAAGPVWEWTSTVGTVALWVTVPPLVLWGIWLMSQRRAGMVHDDVIDALPPASRPASSADSPRAIDAGRAEELSLGASARREAARVERDRR